MNRKQLLTVYTTEGGLSTGLQRTFVSQACPHFKVDVSFHPVSRPERNASGQVTLDEDGQDIITMITGPYLNWSFAD